MRILIHIRCWSRSLKEDSPSHANYAVRRTASDHGSKFDEAVAECVCKSFCMEDLLKFQHNFEDAINPLCSCGKFVESTTHFFLHCTHFSNQRLTLINKIKDIDKRIFDKNDSLITQNLLFGDEKLSTTDNKSILEATIQFLISSGRFDLPLF